MWVSLAGPLSNFLMALLAAIPFRLGLLSVNRASALPRQILPTLDMILYQFIFINLILLLFNLIPLAPLENGEWVGQYYGSRQPNDLVRFSPAGLSLAVRMTWGNPAFS